MAIKTDQEIAEGILDTVTSNGTRDISGEEMRTILIDLNDSKPNKAVTDALDLRLDGQETAAGELDLRVTALEEGGGGGAVDSVNGQVGVVALTTTHIPEGTQLYFTQQRAADSVASRLANTARINLFYDGVLDKFTADLATASITDSYVKNGANIGISKLGTGQVSTSVFNHLVGVTSPIQTQLDGKAAATHNQNASTIQAGTFGAGNFTFPAALRSARYELDTDLLLYPVAGGQSKIKTYWGMLLNGLSKTAAQVDPTYGTTAWKHSVAVAPPDSSEPQGGSLLVRVAESYQTGNAFEVENSSETDLFTIDKTGAVNAAGRILARGAIDENSTVPGIQMGYGPGGDSPRFHLCNGSAAQSWQIDNFYGTMRFFLPLKTATLQLTETTIGFNGNIISGAWAANPIANAYIASGLDAVKIGGGQVSNTEFSYLDGVTSAIQPQLDAKVAGPASATDNALARFDLATGKVIQSSNALLLDTGDLQLAGPLSVINDSAAAFAIGKSNLTNPAFSVDTSGATVNTGLKLKPGNASVALAVDSSATNANISITAKGTDGRFSVNSKNISIGSAGFSTQFVGTGSGGAIWAFSYGGNSGTGAGANDPIANFNFDATRSWNAGAVPLQQCTRFKRTTLAANGASTFANVSTLSLDGPPIAGSNATFTDASALYLPTATVVAQNSYGINAEAPTGSVNNYAAKLGAMLVTGAGVVSGATWQGTAIANAYLGSGIDATKIGGGAVDNTEFSYLDGVTSSIQTQLNGKAATAHNQNASTIQAGTFGAGAYTFPGDLTINGIMRFGASGNYRVPDNRYAFQSDSYNQIGLFFNGTAAQYEFFNFASTKTLIVGAGLTPNCWMIGDLEQTTAGTGHILKSPNGTRYKVTVTDAGALNVAPA